MWYKLVQLLLLWAVYARGSIEPAGSELVGHTDVAATNAAIKAQSKAAVAQGRPATWLVSFRTSEQQIADQAQAISAASALPAAEAMSLARQQVFASVKTRVLGTALIDAAIGLVGPEAVGAQPQSSLQIESDYANLPITAVSISSAAELARLRAHPDVLSVTPNLVVGTANTRAFYLVGQPMATARGYLGSGNTAVIIDTGLDYVRPLFGPCTAPGVPAETCRVVYAEDLEADDGVLDETEGSGGNGPHGTSVAGIIASVAPGVKFVAFDVFNPQGQAFFSTIVKAVDWAVANKAKYNITVINMSLGAEEDEEIECDDWAISVACNSAAEAGIMSVAASGNAGNKTSILVPACAAKVVAVGAVYPYDVTEAGWTIDPDAKPKKTCTDRNAKPDQVICFSNSNSKVALLAPGYEIEAAGTKMSGTSQATPFVAAAMAIVRGRYPSYTYDQVLELLKSTGVKVKDPVNNLTIPRLSLTGAMGISCAPRLTPDSIKAAAAGGSYTLTVTPPAPGCTWQVAAPTVMWMRAVGATSGTGPGTVVLQVDAAAAAARTCGMVVNAPDGSSSMLVSQAAATATMTDSRPPIMMPLTATSANAVVDLSWPAARDSQSGVSSYRVVYKEGMEPPSLYCTTGTLVAQQPQVSGGTLKLTVTGLTVGTRYTFRVCPLDAAGNVAGGRMHRVTVQR